MTHGKSSRHRQTSIGASPQDGAGETVLEIVVKTDSTGSQEAVVASVKEISHPAVALRVIHAGVGPISKSDLLMAATASRLIVGFDVDVSPGLPELSREQGIEIRLYNVIYRLTSDIRQIVQSLHPREAREQIIGKAKVIALFKASGKGTILGCHVSEGALIVGKAFRVISAMGTIYEGKIASLHIEKDTVTQATTGQNVGLRITRFKGAKLGDLVESYDIVQPSAPPPWNPKGGIFRFYDT